MAEKDTTPEVSLEMQASPPTIGAKDNASGSESNADNAADEKPPNPPRRDYSGEKPVEHYARVQKRRGIGSFPRPHFVYKSESSESWMSCLKISLILFNLFIWALGAAVTALGVWIKADEDFWKIQNNLDVKQFTTAGWVLIFIGVIIMLVGFIGCYGAIMSQMCFLLIFAVIVCIVIIMEIVVMALVWTAVSNKNTQEEIKLKAKRAMAEMLRDDTKRDFIELLQAKLQCCGVDGPADYSIDPSNLIKIPPSCTDEGTGSPYKRGCYQTVLDYLQSKAAVVGGVAVAVFILQLAALILTVCMVCGLKQAATSFI